MKNLKTNVSIKFTTIEEYREIERTLVSMGYVNDEQWNSEMLKMSQSNYKNLEYYVLMYRDSFFEIHNHNHKIMHKYNSLQEFLT